MLVLIAIVVAVVAAVGDVGVVVVVVVLAAAVVHAVVADGMNFDVVLSVIIAVFGCLLLVLDQSTFSASFARAMQHNTSCPAPRAETKRLCAQS